MNSRASEIARHAGRQQLATALRNSRARTLALLDAYALMLGPELKVPFSEQLNPPLWEAGHVGWFQDYWLARNQQRSRGIAAEPEHARPEGRLPQADALYNSSRVAHATRWDLALPDLAATRAYLAEGLAESLALLAKTPETDRDLYFFRLVLFHEDMHGEAGIYMAQALGITPPEGLWRAADDRHVAAPPTALNMPTQRWQLGYADSGFAFDNELAAHAVDLDPYIIESEVVSWERYLPFVDATGAPPPRYLRRRGKQWERQLFGEWQPLPLAEPATHLSWFEADAWCRWAGCRLPSEAEWEAAALSRHLSGQDSRRNFHWGEVWEWTASRFQPYPGFSAHPYRDYSVPGFEQQRYVLRGASRATSLRMAHPRYRNFFTPERNDVHTGFRCCRH